MDKQDLLIEIGTEELPPKSLKQLAVALEKEFCEGLAKQELAFKKPPNWYATPRRLALLIEQLDTHQQDKNEQRRGPSCKVAFADDGKPTKALAGFARSCGVAVDQLETLTTDKGSWLVFNHVIKGEATKNLIPALLGTALKRLPIAKRMRWGDNKFEFVRPVKWLLALLGKETIEFEIMGVRSDNKTFGHRAHHPEAITIDAPKHYISQLEQGSVIADYDERRKKIERQINKSERQKNGRAIDDPNLLDEVTALVEYPTSFIGEFDPDFLKLPPAVLIETLKSHQKCFPMWEQGRQGKLLPLFIGFANINSTDLTKIISGNERVVEARLKDAQFFWERDLKYGLANHIEGLKQVVDQKQLGTLHDKSQRLNQLVSHIAKIIGADVAQARRAAALCLCDLATEMVTEFPRLQGTMGFFYAKADGEHEDVALAIEEYYQPRFAGDDLPQSAIGQVLAIAAKLDAIVGIFIIGRAPTGDKDPFGARRAAIGLLRIIIECKLELDLKELLGLAISNYPDHDKKVVNNNYFDDVIGFLLERLRYYYLGNISPGIFDGIIYPAFNQDGISLDTFEAVLAIQTTKPLDFHKRLKAVEEFRPLSTAQNLIAANKRISNILKKSALELPKDIKAELLVEQSEQALADTLKIYQARIQPLLDKQNYQQALMALAEDELCDKVDLFFEEVMVLCDDEAIKFNRLTLLSQLNGLFLKVADFAKLQG